MSDEKPEAICWECKHYRDESPLSGGHGDFCGHTKATITPAHKNPVTGEQVGAQLESCQWCRRSNGMMSDSDRRGHSKAGCCYGGVLFEKAAPKPAPEVISLRLDGVAILCVVSVLSGIILPWWLALPGVVLALLFFILTMGAFDYTITGSIVEVIRTLVNGCYDIADKVSRKGGLG